MARWRVGADLSCDAVIVADDERTARRLFTQALRLHARLPSGERVNDQVEALFVFGNAPQGLWAERLDDAEDEE